MGCSYKLRNGNKSTESTNLPTGGPTFVRNEININPESKLKFGSFKRKKNNADKIEEIPDSPIKFKGRGKIQARPSTQKMGPLSNVNKLFRYVHKRRDGNITAEVSQPRLHNQNVNAGCSPF